MMLSLVMFMLGSGLCGGARYVGSMDMLIAARAVQGMGGGGIIAMTEISELPRLSTVIFLAIQRLIMHHPVHFAHDQSSPTCSPYPNEVFSPGSSVASGRSPVPSDP
jgi:hypothetical protein